MTRYLPRTLALAVLVLFLSVCPGYCTDAGMGIIQPKGLSNAPDFSLVSIDGRQLSVSGLKGKVLLLNFWGTWCEPCREEMPKLEAIWRELGPKGLAVVAIALDRGNIHRVGELCRMHDVTFPVSIDQSGSTASAYGATVMPTSFIIGKDGAIKGKIVGPRDWTGAASRKFFERILNE